MKINIDKKIEKIKNKISEVNVLDGGNGIMVVITVKSNKKRKGKAVKNEKLI